MTEYKASRWAHVALATFIASGFAAVPFWTHGLSLAVASVAAAVIFPAVIVAYVFVMRENRN